MTKNELLVFCESQIREHSRIVRHFLELLHAVRATPKENFEDEDDEGRDG